MPPLNEDSAAHIALVILTILSAIGTLLERRGRKRQERRRIRRRLQIPDRAGDEIVRTRARERSARAADPDVDVEAP